jgi:protoporphyrinogen oxidase
MSVGIAHAKSAVIIGAGPAGLTAAHELLTRTGIKPIVLEAADQVGGLASTFVFKGNRLDIGGHRFFAKSDRVMDWWLARMPLDTTDGPVEITYHRQQRVVTPSGSAPSGASSRQGAVMLVRERRSRVYYRRQFFSYPITLSVETLRKLGPVRTAGIGISYLWSRMFPIMPERNLEEFFINRFGERLYRTFFKAYTEKVWGVPCREIGAEWGAQRIKGLSPSIALWHAIAGSFAKRDVGDIRQKGTQTSLIERFLYPRLGPGQMWELVADEVTAHGGEVRLGWRVDGLQTSNGRVTAVEASHAASGDRRVFSGDYVFSTMPVRDLMRGLGEAVPAALRVVSDGLVYRDFITVGLLVRKMRVTEDGERAVRDNWIYIQEPDVKIGRLQIFNNWSPDMVADPDTVWLGLEYFCDEGDALWSMSDDALRQLGGEELDRIGLIDRADVIDGTVIRVAKTYPAYAGTYDRFGEIRAVLDAIPNLFPIGRNGMHRYNNQDHSMLTAMTAVDNILEGRTNKDNLWDINTEQDYHEDRA